MARFIEDLKKSHGAGELRTEHVDTVAVLMGWVDATRDHGQAIFVDLRDRSGLVQVVFDAARLGDEGMAVAGSLRQEYVVAVKGTVRKRAGKANPNLPTGEIEVVADSLELLNRCSPMPFSMAALQALR